MANGSGTGRVTAPGVALCSLILILIAVSIWLFATDQYWFTPLASVHGAAVDQVFVAVLIATGVAFIAVQGLLAYFVLRYGSNGNDRASYWHDNAKVEAPFVRQAGHTDRGDHQPDRLRETTLERGRPRVGIERSHHEVAAPDQLEDDPGGEADTLQPCRAGRNAAPGGEAWRAVAVARKTA